MNTDLFSLKAGERASKVLPAVTTVQLVQYAGASGDFNRIHYDHPFAVEAGLGGVIAHGMLTMGFMARAVGEWAGPSARVQHIAARFTAPVRPGDCVRIEATVKEPLADGAMTCELGAFVGDARVATGEARVTK
jgi:acyl dehydratase